MHIQQSTQKPDYKTETSILCESIKLQTQIFCASTSKQSLVISQTDVNFLDFNLFSW